jgi:hypothetical protein
MIFKLKMKNVQHMESMLGMRWSDEKTTVIICFTLMNITSPLHISTGSKVLCIVGYKKPIRCGVGTRTASCYKCTSWKEKMSKCYRKLY